MSSYPSMSSSATLRLIPGAAISKSRHSTASPPRFKQVWPAFRTRDSRSAPVKPWQTLPRAKLAQDLLIGVFLSLALRIETLSSGRGRPTQSRVSRRPGLSIAASMSPGRLVAAMMYIPSLDPEMPSSSVRRVLTTRLEASERLELRVGTRASNSSKNRTQGIDERARVNTWRIARSDSPTYWKRLACVLGWEYGIQKWGEAVGFLNYANREIESQVKTEYPKFLAITRKGFARSFCDSRPHSPACHSSEYVQNFWQIQKDFCLELRHDSVHSLYICWLSPKLLVIQKENCHKLCNHRLHLYTCSKIGQTWKSRKDEKTYFVE